MEVKLKARGEVLYLDYVEFSKRVRKSLKLKDTKANRLYALKHIIPEYEYRLKKGISTTANYKFSHYADIILKQTKEQKKLNTFLVYQQGVKAFLNILGDKNIDCYNVADIENFTQILEQKGITKSISVYLAPISRAFDTALRREIISKNPVKLALKPTLKAKEKTPFSLLQMRQLIDNATGELKTFLYIAFYTGMRAGEILALTKDDILQNHIVVKRTKCLKANLFNSPKNGKARKVFLPYPLAQHLSQIEMKNGKELIISLGYNAILSGFHRLQERLGFTPQSLHVTRHTFASLLMNAKINPTLVQHLLGHSNLAMTSLYSHYIENSSDKELLNSIFS